MDILRAFVSWSGGKESSLACYRAMTTGIQIVFLLNMLSEDGSYSRSHGISSELLRIQADAMEIPIVQRKTTWQIYEEEFKKAVMQLKEKGINAGVFGDIDLQEHRDWVERVCKECGIKPLLPLWNEDREKLLKEFISLGFKAIVCSVNSDFLDREWLGKEIDTDFIVKLKELGSVDICGERGEYHTFVYDGPIFKRTVKFNVGEKILKEKRWFLELKT